MRPPGSFKIPRAARPRTGTGPAGSCARRLPGPNAVLDDYFDPFELGELRVQKIIDSLRHQIVQAGPHPEVRIRKVFETPREIYRIELEVPTMNYLRTTLLDREALEELLAAEDVRSALDRPRVTGTEGGKPG